jgi:hypothetical protein
MIAKLGLDVLDLVVDALVGDKLTLCMCALASPVLRRRARHHLFSDIRVTSLARASALVDLLDADPAIGGCVESLTVSGWNPAWVIAPLPTGLCALLPRFPRLVALKLDGIWCRPADRAWAMAAALPTSLRRLELCHTAFITEADIVALLTAAPHLRYVVVFECDYLALEGPRRHMPVPTVEPEELTAIPHWDVMHVYDGEPAASWLAVVSPRRLASLTVTLYYESDVPFWQARINQAGSVMRKLEISHCDLTCAHACLYPSADLWLIRAHVQVCISIYLGSRHYAPSSSTCTTLMITESVPGSSHFR